jgi:hypothetical protein
LIQQALWAENGQVCQNCKRRFGTHMIEQQQLELANNVTVMKD